MAGPSIQRVVTTVVAALEDGKATDIQTFNTARRTSMFSAIIIASAASARQVNALAKRVQDACLKIKVRPLGTEGEDNNEWVLVDLGAVVVHLMQPSIRAYYSLEKLWEDSVPVKVRPRVNQANQA